MTDPLWTLAILAGLGALFGGIRPLLMILGLVAVVIITGSLLPGLMPWVLAPVLVGCFFFGGLAWALLQARSGARDAASAASMPQEIRDIIKRHQRRS
jgi:hypothetical protein